MSEERELLRRSLKRLDKYGENDDFIAEIKELLNAPELVAYVAEKSVGFDVSHSAQGMPLIWLGKLMYGDKLYRLGDGNE